MISRYTHNTVTWVDLESPTQDEVRSIMEEFSINPHIAEELLVPTLKPKVDFVRDYIYLILHFPAFKHSHIGATNQEVDFILGKNFIITTHYDTIDPLHKFSKVFEVNSILDRSDIDDHAGFVFYYMIKKLYKSVIHELEYMSDSLSETEAKMFGGFEREMVVEISKTSRELLNFKQVLQPHGHVLASFEVAGAKFFGKEFEYHLTAIRNEYYRVSNEIDSSIATVSELRETNNSLVSTKQNEIMKTLTIMAFVTFPLSLVASIFGMNTQYLPIVGHQHDFLIITSGMGVAMLLFFVYFKYKRWL